MRVVAGEGTQRTIARARGLEIPLPGNPRQPPTPKGRVRTTRWRAHRCARSSSSARWSSIRASGGLGPRPSLTGSAPDPQHAANILGARRRRRIRTAPPHRCPQRPCPPILSRERGAQPTPRPSFCLSATASPWVSDGLAAVPVRSTLHDCNTPLSAPGGRLSPHPWPVRVQPPLKVVAEHDYHGGARPRRALPSQGCAHGTSARPKCAC